MNQVARIRSWILCHAFLDSLTQHFNLQRLHPEEFRLPPAFCCGVIYPMEPWELESSLALRQLDRLGQDKTDYLTLDSAQQQTREIFILPSFHFIFSTLVQD